MTRKTLSEAAKEALDASRRSADKEPMHKLADTGSGLDSVRDIGGSTWADPEGNEVGSASAGGAPSAVPPGVQPDASSKEPMHVETKTKSTVDSGTNKVDLAKAVSGSDSAKIHDLAKEEADLEAARKARYEDLKAAMKSIGGVEEDMKALFGGESLSEDFKTKATTIFEAAVLQRAVSVVEAVEKEILQAAEEAVEETRDELEEQIGVYLDLMLVEWVKNNEVAIESGLRAEIVESFIHGLKNLFAEHYVDVPAEQVDLVSAQAEEIDTLTDKVNEAINLNAKLVAELNTAKKEKILNKVCEGLTATAAEKVKTLAEGVEFVSEDDYAKKVKVLKEGYTDSPKVKDGQNKVIALTESASGTETQTKTDEVAPSVAAHLRTLR
jgi:hypothetical protein